VTVNEVPEIAQPEVVVAKLTAPAPEPPLEVSVIVSPATAVFVALLTVSVDCGAAVNVKLTAAEFAAAKIPFAALVAITTQVAGLVTVSAAVEMAQPSVAVVNVTAPEPEPPAEVRVMLFPATAVLVALLIVNVACVAAAIVNEVLAEVTEA
jgi:hypothetical protein